MMMGTRTNSRRTACIQPMRKEKKNRRAINRKKRPYFLRVHFSRPSTTLTQRPHDPSHLPSPLNPPHTSHIHPSSPPSPHPTPSAQEPPPHHTHNTTPHPHHHPNPPIPKPPKPPNPNPNAQKPPYQHLHQPDPSRARPRICIPPHPLSLAEGAAGLDGSRGRDVVRGEQSG